MSASRFELDKQTLDDLAIFPNDRDERSIFSLLDHTVTFGGRDKFKEIFKAPLNDIDEIEERINVIRYLQKVDIGFLADRAVCDYIEFYLIQYNKPTSISKIRAIEKRISFFFTGNNAYYIINRGISNVLALLKQLSGVTRFADDNELPKLLQQFFLTIKETLEHPDFVFIQRLFSKKALNAIDIARTDHLFRYIGFERLKTLLDIVYQLDVFMSIGSRGKYLGFSFPVVNRSGERVLDLRNVFHPLIQDPVSNSIHFSHDKNLCFVTGANMAGKSTFLKSTGICVYLSQLGFPVPATYMETSVFDGLITTINLADNLDYGNSHFYTEVSRVKHVAKKMAESQNMLIIFDELFRGTNVKDAFEASLAIISSFAKLRKSFFVVSTHIVEVATELSGIENINFKFMETNFDNKGIPFYSYLLQDGITAERLGMWIVRNEGIVEIIEEIVNRSN